MAASDVKEPIEFCTLGMFIIDEIHPAPTSPDQTIHRDIIGGGGTYSALGARLLSHAPALSRRVSWIIDAGHDFPAHVRETITSWQTHAVIRARANNEPTTRGWNGYSANEHRDFKYLTPKKRLTADDLSEELLASKSFHLICSATRCVEQVQQILARRAAEFSSAQTPPLMIWEPVPDLCIPSELPATLDALAYIDVISPNHDELASLFSSSASSTSADSRLPFDSEQIIEAQAQHLLSHALTLNKDTHLSIVVRCGARGCYVLNRVISQWLPAWHTDARRVIDPTGGGNGFLGGLAIGLVRCGREEIVEAARWGSVAASFCIEQVGVPKLEVREEGEGDDGSRACELWNRESVAARLQEFQKRTDA